MPIPRPNPWKNVPHVGILIDDVQEALDPAEAVQWADMILYDTFSNRPAAGVEGRLFWATDTNTLYRDNASTWDTLSSGDLAAHLSDTDDAHDASAISLLDTAGDFSATNVEAAIAEMQTDIESLLGASVLTRIAVDLRQPQTAANAGNVFPTNTQLTAWENYHWEFLKDVDGKLYGIVRLPTSFTPTAQKVILELMANATSGVSRMSVKVQNIADGASMNPASLDGITAQDITFATTARLRRKITFTDATNTWAAGDILIIEVFHEGAHANDTVAVNTELLGAWVEIT